MVFAGREEAGRLLGEELAGAGLVSPVVFGIPRGGVATAAAAAAVLGAPLDVVVTAKIRAPNQRELGLGAVAPDGTAYLDRALIALLGVEPAYLAAEIAERSAEVGRRAELYRGGRPAPEVEGRAVVVIDDGIATGGTMICAARFLRKMHPREVVVAVPVAPRSSLSRLRSEADRLFCLETPLAFTAVGEWYRNFEQLDDRQVIEAMEGMPHQP